jgi:hypothetical protein
MMKQFFTAMLLCSFFFGTAQTKRVLIEEGTGTWCQWCPRGAVYAHKMMVDYDAIPIAIHSGDAMETANIGAYGTTANFGGYPSGHVDRVNLDVDPLNWGVYTATQSSLTPPADLLIATVYDSVSRSLDIDVTVEMYSSLNGDYRIGAVVVEDAVTGPAPAYSQSNAYSGGGNGPMGGYENLPSPVPASQMAYDHVARYLATSYGGDAGSLPTSLVASNQYNYALNWTVPIDQDEQYVYVVAFMTDAATGEVLNTNKSIYLMGDTNAIPKFLSSPVEVGLEGSLYQYDVLTHDPDDDILSISMLSGPSWLSVSSTGDVSAVLSGTPTASGTYAMTLEVSDGNSSRLQSFDILVSASTGEDWYFVGAEGCTPSGAYKTDLSLSSQDIPYLMYTKDNDQVVVQRYQNAAWSAIGSPINGNQFAGAMDLAPNDTPYVVTTNTNGQVVVYEWNSGNWQQLGGTLGGGASSLDIAVADDSTIYVAFMDTDNSSMGICKMWDGSSWVTVGGSHFSSATAVWTRLVCDSQSQPYVLYATGSGWGPFYGRVAHFDGSTWSDLGGGDIDNVATAWNHSIAINSSDQIYVSASTETSNHILNVYAFDGSNWQNIGSDIGNGAVYYNDIAIDAMGNPSVAFEDETTGKTSVLNYDGTNWLNVGLPLFTNASANHSLAYDSSGVPYVAYQEETLSDKISVKRYGQYVSTVKEVEQQLAIYPNPTADFCYVQAEGMHSYKLYDLQARLLQAGVVSQQQEKIDLRQLEDGMYILLLEGEKKSKSVKLIKH